MIIKIILLIVDNLINILPGRCVFFLGRVIGSLFYYFDRRHRQLALLNINKVFGNKKSYPEIKEIARKSFQHFGTNLMEFLRGLPEEITAEGTEQASSLLAEGKAVIFVIAHLGNWELMGRVATRQFGVSLVAVGRRIKNRAVDRFIKEKRINWGIELLPKKGSLSGLLKALHSGKSVAILVDQYAGRKGIFVDFFGIPTSTTPSPAILALRTGAPIFPVFMIREGIDRHHLVVTPALPVTDSGDISRDIKEITQQIANRLEEYIERYPEQWWWVHRRWRTAKIWKR